MQDKYLRNVTTLRLSPAECTGCGMCADVCPQRVFIILDGRAQIKDKDNCMECGACAQNCPAGAIEVTTGVGCAAAIIKGWLTKSEPSCDCSGGDCC